MDGYTILVGFLLFFSYFLFIITWFGFLIKVENGKR